MNGPRVGDYCIVKRPGGNLYGRVGRVYLDDVGVTPYTVSWLRDVADPTELGWQDHYPPEYVRIVSHKEFRAAMKKDLGVDYPWPPPIVTESRTAQERDPRPDIMSLQELVHATIAPPDDGEIHSRARLERFLDS